MVATTIKKLIESGDLKVLIAAGVVSPKVKTQYEIYERFTALLHPVKAGKKMRVSDLVFDVAEEFKTSEMSVYRALKAMKA